MNRKGARNPARKRNLLPTEEKKLGLGVGLGGH